MSGTYKCNICNEEVPKSLFHWCPALNGEKMEAELRAQMAGKKRDTHAERKAAPVARGVLDYFPLAIMEVARLSKVCNDQHNPGEPMHWAKEKSPDHADCIARHLIDRGTIDTDGMRHSTKVAWRALALLQIELEQESKSPQS